MPTTTRKKPAPPAAAQELRLPQEMLDPDVLRPHPSNAKRHDDDWLRASVAGLGQFEPVTVNTRGGGYTILSGHGRIAAWKAERPGELIQATVLDVDEGTALRILANSNPGPRDPGYDPRSLLELLTQLQESAGGLDVTAWEPGDISLLLDELGDDDEDAGGGGPIIDPDVVDELPEHVPAVTQPGDIWQLGPHRVICGDATDPNVLRALLDGAPVHCVWTDPPYGVDYVGGTKDKLTIKNDGAKGLPLLLAGAFRTLVDGIGGGVPVYVAGPSGPGSAVFERAWLDAGLVWRQTLVWVKNALVLGRSDYHYRHEPIMYGATPEVDDAEPAPVPGVGYESNNDQVFYGFTPGGIGRLGRGGERWYGDHKQTSVLEFPKPLASAEHPTMKPVALVQAMLSNSAPKGGNVLDLFGGSGSTLIAANQIGAVGFLVELDPHYVDVICARWNKATGITAVKVPS